MSAIDPQMLDRARHARDTLAQQLLSHPDVSLIDIGRDPEGASSHTLVVRVHVRRPLDREALGIPEEIEGIPVRILRGNYQLE